VRQQESGGFTIERFRQLSIAWVNAANQLNNRVANRIARELRLLAGALKEQNRGDELSALLDDPDDAIRLIAAKVMLKSAPERAVPVLKAFSNGPPGLFRIEANSVLFIWSRDPAAFD